MKQLLTSSFIIKEENGMRRWGEGKELSYGRGNENREMKEKKNSCLLD